MTEVPPTEMMEATEETGTEENMMERSGVLRVAMQPVVNIDPLLISSDSEVLLANHVYDYLVDVDAQSNPVPRLATSWEVSDDGKTYTFQLAEGVTFHDGSPFSAADVVWTFDRLRNTADTPTQGLYANVLSVEATGDLEVTFTLENPNPFFLYDLSDNHALILKANTTDADRNFNGTGPFVVTQYTPEDRVVMTANEKYFIPGEPHLAGLEIIFFNDETASAEALKGGQVDLIMRMSTSLFESLKGESGILTVDIPTNGFDLVRLRSDRAPGNDPNVIRALKLATDREAIWQVVQQGYGAVGNDSPIGPLYAAYHDAGAVPPARDITAATALLGTSGYTADNPLQLTLHTPDTGGRPDLAAVLKAQWEETGVVQIEISVEPESVYYADPGEDGEAGWLGVDLGITGWGSRPYPQFYLDTMLVCGAQWNESHFCDEAFDQLAKTAGTTLNEQERVDAYKAIQQLLLDHGPVIIPYYFAQFGAISDQFEGFELKAFAGRTDFRSITFVGGN
ncbi:MAG: ABC transporter substrate-binding protein [Anaerolineales bacterium]|nr:ABC transporter substrate-binding protein [Anaerolineales bacterium]